ncbi:MAG: rhodanese-like domain-containing protein [Candidatus Omnitrophica bacterium]|nr:rhodanese-like domain-containing protein [Candidatus Omnitrophota bacterium]
MIEKFVQMLILVIVSFVLGLGINGLSSKPLSLLAHPDQFKVVHENEAKSHEIMDLWKSGMAIFIDARSAEAYAEGHIPGAFSIPYTLFDEGQPPEVEMIPRDQDVVIYCDGADCHASQVVADRLEELGYVKTRLKIFSGGWQEWTELGGEVEQEEGANES